MISKSPKKILCIHQGWELYGSDRSFLLNLESIIDFYESKIDIEVVLPRSGSIISELELLTKNISIEDMGKIERWYAKKHPFKSLYKAIKASFHCRKKMKQADIVYINTIVPFGYLIGSLFLRKKVIIHIREIPSPILARIFKAWFKLCRLRLIFNSETTRKAFRMENYKRGKVILNSVEKIEELPDQNQSENEINLLLIGRINAWKGQRFFVESFSKLPGNIQQKYKVRIVGNTPDGQEYYLTELKEAIMKSNLKIEIDLCPFTNNPAEHYNWANIVIVPSIFPEPFGRVSIEGFSIGKPVIAANHGGLSEIIIDGYNGWHFAPGSHEELKSLLNEIHLDKFKIEEKGINAIKSFNEKYTIDLYKKQLFSYWSTLNN